MYPKQESAIFNDERFALIEASTKSGKTVGCMAWLFEQAIYYGGPNRNFWWIAPSRSQAKDVYDRMKTGLPSHIIETNETDRKVTLVPNGSILWFKTGEEPDLLYGADVYAAVLDEASRMRQDTWVAIQSTLTATKGPVRIIGNVKGRKNWFYRMARRAETGEPGMSYAKITCIDAIEAGVLDPSVVEDARRNMPEAMFRELYYAEPGEDEGNPFGIDAIFANVAPRSAEPVVAWGWDLARTIDYTVGIGLDKKGHVAQFHRWRTIPWRAQVERVRVLTGSTPALIDSSGVGDPVVEFLQAGGDGQFPQMMNFQGYPTHVVQNKMKLIEGLIGAIQGGLIKYPKGPITMELESFEYEYASSAQGVSRGYVIYSAPEDMHDDCVIALSLAYKKWKEVAILGASPMIYTARNLGVLPQ